MAVVQRKLIAGMNLVGCKDWYIDYFKTMEQIVRNSIYFFFYIKRTTVASCFGIMSWLETRR
jgi:hypothetical protein